MEQNLELLISMTRDGFTGINKRLDTLNGQTGSNTTNIARLDERLKSVEQRDTQETTAEAWSKRQLAGVISLVTALVYGVLEGVKRLWH